MAKPLRVLLGLGGDTLRRGCLAHTQHQADTTENDYNPEHQKGSLPVVLDPGVLEGRCRFESDHTAELVSRPPADDRGRGARRHAFALGLADLLDSQRIDGDVLSGGGGGDNQADGDHDGQVRRRFDDAPQDEARQDHGLQGDDPGAAVPEPVRQPGHPQPVDQRRPEEIDRVDAEDQSGPADGGAAQTVFLQPEAESAADEHPGKAADDPEQEDASHAPFDVDRERFCNALHERFLKD